MTKQIEKPAKAKKYRALVNLVYSDLKGEEWAGKPLAMQGQITELYPELIAREDLIQMLLTQGRIEEVPEVQIIRPEKEEVKTEE